MNDLNKIKIAKILFFARFWVATMVLYLTSRDISIGHVFQLIGFYYVMSVLLEYPTGVIGDYYSHKTSVFLGYFILALSYILLSFSGGILFYGITLFLLALGGALVSGSDNALLYTVSTDFKKDFAQVKFYGIFSTFTAVSIGGFVSALDLRIPLYLTSFFLITASLLVFSTNIKTKGNSEENDIIKFGIEGFKYAIKNTKLLNIMVISSLIGAFFFSFKWLYNPLFQKMELDVSLWGILIGIATLLAAVGIKIYSRYSKSYFILAIFILLMSVMFIGFTGFPIIALSGLFISHLMRGYFETKLMVDMNSVIKKSVRSSVLSLNSLLIRGGATSFMFFGGMILDKYSIMILMLILVFLFLAIGAYSLIKVNNLKSS